VRADDLRRRLRGVLAPPPPEPAGTSREQLLALAELGRRIGGDVPGGDAVLDLSRYELRVFSQNGEDGVLAEILRRSGAPGRWFVEFGAGDGVENNCAVLADVLGWHGLFMDAGEAQFARLAHRYAANPRVITARAMVTPEAIDGLLDAHGVPPEPDVLSIDVDGSDYWIWEALTSRRPRVVVIEYNGALEPARRLVQPRDAGPWDETEFYGASIGALEALGVAKGYRLVHCEMTGNNAFFVRHDLPGDYLPPDEVPRRRTNFWLEGVRHRPDPHGRRFVDLDAQPARQAQSEP
jgi:hypothetical protein